MVELGTEQRVLTSQLAREHHIRLEATPAREVSITVTVAPAVRGNLHFKYKAGELWVAEAALYVLIASASELSSKLKKNAYHHSRRWESQEMFVCLPGKMSWMGRLRMLER